MAHGVLGGLRDCQPHGGVSGSCPCHGFQGDVQTGRHTAKGKHISPQRYMSMCKTQTPPTLFFFRPQIKDVLYFCLISLPLGS